MRRDENFCIYDPRNVLGMFIQAGGSVAPATRRRQVGGLEKQMGFRADLHPECRNELGPRRMPAGRYSSQNAKNR